MQISRFRSIWGVDPGANLEKWKEWFPCLKRLGYSGVEVDILVLNPEHDFPLLRDICDHLDLKISVVIFSSLPQSQVLRSTGLNADMHLQRYREQLQLAAQLRPVKINAQDGQDSWAPDESVKFYKGTLQIDSELGLSGVVCHETHRSRSLCNPYVTEYILEQVPDLRITADLSHWMLVCERILDVREDDRAVLAKVIPHVHHIHARIGTTQSSQCPDPTNPVFREERQCFERLWQWVIKERFERDGDNTHITFVPEYGPFPYHPYGSQKFYGAVADEEGARLQTFFEEFGAKLTPE
ncbi:hypothetical protein V1505DRAFT_377780 [Lipomyces doorenjongii]